LFSFLTPPCFLEQFHQVLFFYFHIWIQNTFIIFTLIHSFFMSPCQMVPTLRKDFYYLSILAIISWTICVHWEGNCLCLFIRVAFFLWFALIISKFQNLYYGLWSILSWFLYRLKDRT
jgi:hypothetical protein